MSTQANTPSFSTAAQGAIVTIKVGLLERPYQVHKDVLRHYSAYFERAFKNLRADAEYCLTLSDTEPGVFNVFIDWLYSGKLPGGRSWWAKVSETADSFSDVKLSMLKAMVFGNRFTAPKFEAAVHNELVDLLVDMREAPRYVDIIYAFNHVPGDRALLELLVELHCLYWYAALDAEAELAIKPLVPDDFWRRVEANGPKLVDLEGKRVLTACDYHIHATDEERQACQMAD